MILYTPGPFRLYRGNNFIANYSTYAEAEAAMKARQVALGKSVTFRIEQSIIARGVADPPPPPPVDCVLSEWSDWVAGEWSACVNGLRSREEIRTRSIVTQPANGGAACGPQSEVRTVSEACVVPPPPPPPTGMLTKLLNFAETWNRNWNFGGHSVTDAFTEAYGKWDYTNTTYEPWLFDRATVGHRLFELTGDTRWRDQFLSDFAYYRGRIDANGIFLNKGGDDTKYGYVTPFLLYEKLTGDQQYRPVAKRIYDSWVREWSPTFYPTGGAQLWTEREIGLALEAAVSYFEMTGDAAALNRARALVAQWTHVSALAGAPLVSYTQHEGGGPGGTTPQSLTHSPWMSCLYFQAARRMAALDPASVAEIQQQASKWFDFLDANAFYDGSLAHVQYAGLVFPRYLTPDPFTGVVIGDAGYDYGNMAHALDVAGGIKFARESKVALGLSTDRADLRLSQMLATADRDFQEWTRTTVYLPKYRITPPRKFNWQARGAYELR